MASTTTFSNVFGEQQYASFATLKNMTDLSPKVQRHLIQVYSNLATMMLISAIGSYAYLQGMIMNIGLFSIISLVTLIALPFLNQDRKNLRFSLLYLFSFSKGVILSPLLQSTFSSYPGVFTTAFTTTALVFISFSLSALLSNRRSYLFLGGFIGSGLFLSLMMSFFNSFIRSSGIDFVNLYLGVIIFSAYIIYDTQVIVEKASQGFSDVIIDSLNLFVDFIGLLVRLIILLSKNQQDKERKERERRRR